MADVEAARADERQHAARELDSLRRVYADREAATQRDLIELEKLHAARVGGQPWRVPVAHHAHPSP
jgi:hypothetical protein